MTADTVTALSVGLYPEPGDTEPTLLQHGHRAILIFAAIGPDEQAVTALAEFTGCLATRFGYPGHEALPRHPLYRGGLRSYNVIEVLHSSWLDQFREQDVVAFPPVPEWAPRHFVITLHHSTFECLADDITIMISTTDDAHHMALLRLLDETS
jgi:hypothetical protein